MRILTHAKIYTMDIHQPTAEAMAIDGDHIFAVGTTEEINHLVGPGVPVEDLGGAVILPGLTDSHLHLENYALALSMVDCETPTKEELLRRVAERAAITPPGEWIRGHGWNQHVWEGGFGSKEELDRAAPNHPVFLTQKSLHAAWANTAALNAANVHENTPDPLNGVIERRSDGSLTGILFEEAYVMVEKTIPEDSLTRLAENLDHAQSALWKLGITGVHDFDRRRCFAALQMLHSAQKLQLRVLKSIPRENIPHAAALGLRTGFGDDMLRIGAVKMFADGALGPKSAAMFQPYQGGDQNGMLFMDEEELFENFQSAASNGFSIAIHAIGDRAIHHVLNAYGQLRDYETNHQLPHLRHRIEHVQHLHREDIPRLARYQLTASVQPIHATSDMFTVDRYLGDLGQYAYAFRSLLNASTAYCFGSDAPVEQPNPFFGIHAAVTRQRPGGDPDPNGWYPQQRLSLQEALAGYTVGAAYAAGNEDRAGKIKKGYLADLIVLDQDPHKILPEQLHALLPSATMVAGNWVWHS